MKRPLTGLLLFLLAGNAGAQSTPDLAGPHQGNRDQIR